MYVHRAWCPQGPEEGVITGVVGTNEPPRVSYAGNWKQVSSKNDKRS